MKGETQVFDNPLIIVARFNAFSFNKFVVSLVNYAPNEREEADLKALPVELLGPVPYLLPEEFGLDEGL